MTDSSAKGVNTKGKPAEGKPADKPTEAKPTGDKPTTVDKPTDDQPTADKSKTTGTPSSSNDTPKHGNDPKICACDKCDCGAEVATRGSYCARCVKRCHKPKRDWRKLLKGFAKSKKSGSGWERLDEE